MATFRYVDGLHGPLLFDVVSFYGAIVNKIYIHDTLTPTSITINDDDKEMVSNTLKDILNDPSESEVFIDRVLKFPEGRRMNKHCVGGTYEVGKKNGRSMSFYMRLEDDIYYLLCKLY